MNTTFDFYFLWTTVLWLEDSSISCRLAAKTCYDWFRSIFGLVGGGTEFLPYRLPGSQTDTPWWLWYPVVIFCHLRTTYFCVTRACSLLQRQLWTAPYGLWVAISMQIQPPVTAVTRGILNRSAILHIPYQHVVCTAQSVTGVSSGWRVKSSYNLRHPLIRY